MATPTDADALMNAAACNRCITPGMQGPVMIKLLQDIAGNTMTTDQLIAASKSYTEIPTGSQYPVIIFLLDQIVQAG